MLNSTNKNENGREKRVIQHSIRLSPKHEAWQQEHGAKFRKETEDGLAAGLGPNWPAPVVMIFLALMLGLLVNPLLGIGILAIVLV